MPTEPTGCVKAAERAGWFYTNGRGSNVYNPCVVPDCFHPASEWIRIPDHGDQAVCACDHSHLPSPFERTS